MRKSQNLDAVVMALRAVQKRDQKLVGDLFFTVVMQGERIKRLEAQVESLRREREKESLLADDLVRELVDLRDRVNAMERGGRAGAARETQEVCHA